MRRRGSRPGSCRRRPTRCRTGSGRRLGLVWIASTIACAVACGSHSSPSVTRWTARSMPSAIMSRSCSSASGGPSVSTVDEPPCCSISRTASSTPHSSCGLTVKPRWRVEIARSSSVSTIFPPVRGTRLTQTRTFIGSGADAGVLGIEHRRRVVRDDRNRIALAHVLDRELRCRRPRAPAGGSPSGCTCRATGPLPALVTYERRPLRSVIGSPSRVRIGSCPSM